MTLLSWDMLTLGNNRPKPLTRIIKVFKRQCLFMRLIFLNEGLRIEDDTDICSVLKKRKTQLIDVKITCQLENIIDDIS